jgi:hypothetical protein
MPQQIDVPGMGIVEFPDGMDDDQIAAAIKQNMPKQSVMDKLTGKGGERYQTWPEKAVRGILGQAKDAALLPGRVVQEAQQPKTNISDSDVSAMSVPSTMGFATLASPVNPAVRAGDRAIPGVAGATTQKVKPKVPTTGALKEAGAADIKAARNSGLEVTASSVGDWSRKVQQDLFDSGVHPTLAGNTHKILKELEDAPPGSFSTAANLQALRENLQSVAQNFNPNAAKDQLAASRAIRQLDEFIPNVNPKDVLAGTPAATSELFKRGRGNYAAAQRSNDLTGVLDRAKTGILERSEGRAQAANSGRNIDNTIRSKVEALLEKPKEVSGFSDAELAALNKVVEGGAGRNTAREISNALGGGGGMGATVPGMITAAGAASATGRPEMLMLGAIPPAIGYGSRKVANALAKRSLNQVDELVRTRSPLYQEALKAADSIPSHLGKKATIAKMLLMEALQGKQ